MKKRNIFISLILAAGLLSSCGNANKDAGKKEDVKSGELHKQLTVL